MIQAFIIHDKNCSERDDLVMKLQTVTNATIVEAIMLPNGAEGCTRSHLKVAQLAKDLYPDEPYLVFEDDCVLEDGWDSILSVFPHADVVFLGYTEATLETIFGTHGMYISPKARDVFLAHGIDTAYKVRFPWATDWILPKLCKEHSLIVYRPTYNSREKWCYQKKGVTSQISGKIRH